MQQESSFPPSHHLFLEAKRLCLPPPPTILFLVGGLGAPPNPTAFPGGLRPKDPPSLISLNTSLVGHVTWKCILSSDLKTLEVHTLFGSENPGRVYYFSDLKTMEAYTIFGCESPGSVYYFRI